MKKIISVAALAVCLFVAGCSASLKVEPRCPCQPVKVGCHCDKCECCPAACPAPSCCPK